MKTNEIIQEGPLDFAKNVAAGVKGLSQGGLAGAKAAYGAQAATNVQADKTKAIAKKAVDQWNATAAQLGQQATPQQLTSWMTKFLGKAPGTQPTGTTPAEVNQFITQEITKHIADRAAQGLAGGAEQQPAPTQAPAQATAPAQAQEPAQATAPAAAPEEPAAPAKPDANQFAQKLQADFQAFVDSNGSIGAPAVKQVLKNMWMQAGGTKAESRKNTKKPL